MRGNQLDERFEKLVQESLERWHVPGVSVAVVDGDNTWAMVYDVSSTLDLNLSKIKFWKEKF
jgi:CubicO group peptidase (beta-lactamase class C family)